MKRTTIRHTVPLLVMAAAGALPASGALAASTSKTYKGPKENMRWGPIQVSIVVKNKKITNVKLAMSIESARSQMIDGQAVPLLKQEVLQAQSANINQVSGATDLFDAYTQSLQGAITKAVKAKALK